MLLNIRDYFDQISDALDKLNSVSVSFETDRQVESTLEYYATTYSEFKGSYGILVETDKACVGLQLDSEGNFLPNLIEAYDGENSDYIPDAPDIFDYEESPHRDLIKILENPAVCKYMAYRFIYREPEGSEDDREYAEYRDVFGPMRLSQLKLKLGRDTFISVERWESNTL